jgi:hypothetical protein
MLVCLGEGTDGVPGDPVGKDPPVTVGAMGHCNVDFSNQGLDFCPFGAAERGSRMQHGKDILWAWKDIINNF